MTQDDDDDFEAETTLSADPEIECIRAHGYRPDKFILERWTRALRTPLILCRTESEAQRVRMIHDRTMRLAASILSCCPNSNQQDQALARLQEAQHWALSAIQANE